MAAIASTSKTPISIWTLCEQSGISDQARKFATSEMSPGTLLGKLIDAELYVDVIKLVSHALPKREAIWWGALCVEMISKKDDPPADLGALRSVVQWVIEPNEAHRVQAAYAADECQSASPACSLAQAVKWTGGSMSRPGLPVVPPEPKMTPNAIVAAVRSAATKGDRQTQKQRLRDFLRLAVEVAEGRHHWTGGKMPAGGRST
jgi:hypothetical protein